jgi:hypothetical protein
MTVGQNNNNQIRNLIDECEKNIKNSKNVMEYLENEFIKVNTENMQGYKILTGNDFVIKGDEFLAFDGSWNYCSIGGHRVWDERHIMKAVRRKL